jgi:hypothetical protein
MAMYRDVVNRGLSGYNSEWNAVLARALADVSTANSCLGHPYREAGALNAGARGTTADHIYSGYLELEVLSLALPSS